jgi:hypothetical protein
MVKRSTWLLLAILALAIGAYYFLMKHPSKTTEPTPTATGNSFLLTQADGVLQSLRIYDQEGNTFQMQRDLSKIWVIIAPTSGVADQALADAAESQISALRVVTMLETQPDPSSIGLASPVDTLVVSFANGTSHKIEIGNMTPTGSGYYVRYDDEKIYVISQSGIDAILKLLNAPPYPATETPNPTTESTSTLTPEITPGIP